MRRYYKQLEVFTGEEYAVFVNVPRDLSVECAVIISNSHAVHESVLVHKSNIVDLIVHLQQALEVINKEDN